MVATTAASDTGRAVHLLSRTDGVASDRRVTGLDPTAYAVAATGEPTAVKLLGHNVPAVADLDRNGGRLWLEWRLSRLNVEMTVTLRHTATGATDTAWLHPDNGDSHGPQRANGRGRTGRRPRRAGHGRGAVAVPGPRRRRVHHPGQGGRRMGRRTSTRAPATRCGRPAR
ncbi:hypothetical protein [Streptomyces zhihengii]